MTTKRSSPPRKPVVLLEARPAARPVRLYIELGQAGSAMVSQRLRAIAVTLAHLLGGLRLEVKGRAANGAPYPETVWAH
jgi:hypothetical protein